MIVKKFEKYTGHFTNFPKKVPDPILFYSSYISSKVEEKFDRWFNRKSLANYKDEILVDSSDIGISEEQFKKTPIESMRVVIKFLVTKMDDHFEEGLMFTISDKAHHVGERSFRKKSDNELVDYSYHLEMGVNIYFSSKRGSYDPLVFKKRLDNLIFHEMSHAYENIMNHISDPDIGIESPLGAILKSTEDAIKTSAAKNSNGCVALFNFFRRIYMTSAEEVYANVIASGAFDSVEEFKQSSAYQETVGDLRSFNKLKFLAEIKREIGGEKIKGYYIPDDIPEMFADFYLDSRDYLEKEGVTRQSDDDRYIGMEEMDLEEFLDYWDEEFKDSADYIEEKSIDIINNKLT